MKFQRMDHVGVVVSDLEAAKTFFLDIGLEMLGESEVEGDWVDRIIGLTDVKETVVMFGTPDGETKLELIKFHSPSAEKGIQPTLTTLGITHIAFVVEDIEGIVAKLKKKDTATAGEIQHYKDIYKLCFVQGPEGIILELAERLK
ncbi:VOC family protein [Fictibacillus fluitans]|uniref:VOC family protein n=1 Tax=Fictibacillus fluitans TaxID=3058422 RepID=A0ABT8HYU8_9BACL|nr:VOC family protein [Fictibacillus sp. NE201]MDN4525923.1 VOC family protein [Fictibacillus sp. NE201]